MVNVNRQQAEAHARGEHLIAHEREIERAQTRFFQLLDELTAFGYVDESNDDVKEDTP